MAALINPRYLYAVREKGYFIISNTEAKPNMINVVILFDLLNDYKNLRSLADLVKLVCKLIKSKGMKNRHNGQRELHNQFVGSESDVKENMNFAVVTLRDSDKMRHDVYMRDIDRIIPWYQGVPCIVPPVGVPSIKIEEVEGPDLNRKVKSERIPDKISLM